jgi:hypothetical protein
MTTFLGSRGFGPMGTVTTMTPAQAAWNTVARYDSYDDAQAAVDRLSDDGFPVEQLDIVGSDLQLVERVTGRLTKQKAALAGAGSGAWFGLMIGLLLGLFTAGHAAWLALLLSGIVIGAAWGAVFAWLAHSATRGRRDFASVRTLAASRFDVVARGGTVEAARAMLGRAGLLPAPGGTVGWSA